MSLVLWGTFIALMLARVPIVFAMGLAGALALLTGGVPMTLLVQRMFAQVDSFALLAVPFFILTGSVMGAGGIVRATCAIRRRACRSLSRRVGRYVHNDHDDLFGNFGIVRFRCCGDRIDSDSRHDPARLRTGLCGGAASGRRGQRADHSALGADDRLCVDRQCFRRRDVRWRSHSRADHRRGAAGRQLVVGAAQQSAGRGPASLREVGRATVDAGWALVVPVIILGGILSGVFTATEAGAVAACYSFFVALFVYRELKLRDIHKVVLEAAVVTAQVMIIVAAAAIFGWVLAASRFRCLH